MDNEESVDGMTDLIASSLEGNALSVQNAVNSILSQKALDALSSMRVDVAQSIYGNYGSEAQENEMELDDDSLDSEVDEIEAAEDDSEEETEWEVPEDDDFGTSDDDLADLFNELEDLTDFEETDTDSDNEQEETPDE